MEFCWIPPGEAQPRLSDSRAGLHHEDILRREATGFPGRRNRGQTGAITKPTDSGWSKYEVTQAEWKAVMSYNPSYFDGKKSNVWRMERTRTGSRSTRCKLERVQCLPRCGEQTAGSGGGLRRSGEVPATARGRVGVRGPRRGRGMVASAFYWGGELNGTQANCDGKLPVRGGGEGAGVGSAVCRGRHKRWQSTSSTRGACAVCTATSRSGATTSTGTRVTTLLRGGSWNSVGRSCRSASRNNEAARLPGRVHWFPRLLFSYSREGKEKRGRDPVPAAYHPDLDP